MAAPSHAAQQARSTGLRGLVVLLAVAGALLTLLALSLLHSNAERDAIQRMPATERKVFYARTLDALRTTCETRPDGLQTYCARQAELIVQFPECDAACRKLAQTHMRWPTR